MDRDSIICRLKSLGEPEFAAFQEKLIPGLANGSVIGVRTPALRAMAKELVKDEGGSAALGALRHEYFEENQLQAFIISEIKDYDVCVAELERFLPYIDNWATCDQLSPKVFFKNRGKLIVRIREWIRSEHAYTVRFAVGMLMRHYLDEDFSLEYPETAASIRSEEYYVNMMIAWYFATALTKRYDDILPYIEEKRLPVWTHNTAIRKSAESFRISSERKEYLKSLKIKTK